MKTKTFSKQKAFIFLFFSFIGIIGCSSSTSIYRDNYVENDSKFISRDAGAPVFIEMNNGEEYSGELLTVSDSVMILCNDYGLTERELYNSVKQILMIENHKMKSMLIIGKNNILIGLFFGAGIGTVIGVSVGIASGDDPKSKFISLTAEQKACVLGSFGGIVGGLIGLIVGVAGSTYDEEIYNYKNPEDFDFMQLNIYSRYGGTKPEFLKGLE